MRRPIALLALVIALVAAGCGGGGGGSTSTTDGKAEYGKELAAATAQLQKTFGDISDQTGSNTSSAQIAARLDKGADAIDQSADKFAAITPPAAAKDAHAKLVTGLHEIADQLRKAADAAKRNDSKTLATAYGHQSQIASHVGEFVQQGQVIGFSGCTGHCLGPHVHFETRIDGQAVDPMRFL